MTNILPAYLAIGVSEEKFWDSTPKELKPYTIAYRLNLKARDAEAWRQGMYVMNAFSTVLANCFSKNSKAKYIEKPLLADDSFDNHEPTEEEMKMEREKLLATLVIMQDNFERTKG